MPVRAEAVRALLDDQGIDRADFVGNSIGGWVATTFAATYPARINRLVIIDAVCFKAMFEGTLQVNFDPNDGAEMQELIDMPINSAVAQTPGLAEQAFEAYVTSGEKAIAATWGKGPFVSPRLEELFPKVTAPTLVLWGEGDKLFPSVLTDVFAGQIAGAKAQLIPDASHFPQIDNPEATIAAIAGLLKQQVGAGLLRGESA